jgi:hypothetical protein
MHNTAATSSTIIVSPAPTKRPNLKKSVNPSA